MIKEELRLHNIDLDKIELNDNLFSKIQEAIFKMQEYTSKDKFEVILNNNLIEAKDKYTGFKTIFGCRVSYADLEKDISFIVREDVKPSYEKLEKSINEVLEYLDNSDMSFIDKNEIAIRLKGSDKE